MKASDNLTHPVRTVREDCTLEDAAHAIPAHNIGSLPVTNSEGKLTVSLTESDCAAREWGIPYSRHRLPQVFGAWYAQAGRREEARRRAVAYVDFADERKAVIAKTQKTGFHRLPVVVEGLLAGIITRHDRLRLVVVSGGLQLRLVS